MQIAEFYLNGTYLLWLKKRAVFCVYKVRLNSYIALSFRYLEVSKGSLDGTMKRLKVLKTHAHQ